MLSLAGQEQHGYGIMQEVLERTAGKVRLWPATLYGTLKRLIDEELIAESDDRPTRSGRRPARYYRLTKLGRRVLDAECRRLEDLRYGDSRETRYEADGCEIVIKLRCGSNWT